jgi:hypothetical protein
MHRKAIIMLSIVLALIIVSGCTDKRADTKTTDNPVNTLNLTVGLKHVKHVGDQKAFGVTFADDTGRTIVYDKESNANAIYNCVKLNNNYKVVMYRDRIMSIDGVSMN